MQRIAIMKQWNYTRMKRRTCKCWKEFLTRRKPRITMREQLTTVQTTALILWFLMNLLIIENKQFQKIKYIINEKMRWIICHRCDKVVFLKYIQTHLSRKHQIYYSDKTLDSIISNHRLISFDLIIIFRENIIILEIAIGEILTHENHKYIKCGYCTSIWGSMINHFVKKYNELDAKNQTKKKIEMQASFDDRLKKWFEIIDHNTIEIDEENMSSWETIKILLTKKRRGTRASMRREKNIRLLNNFIAHICWDILIKRHDKKQLRTLTTIAKKKDLLYKMIKISEKYFTKILNKLCMKDILLRRKIELEG